MSHCPLPTLRRPSRGRLLRLHGALGRFARPLAGLRAGVALALVGLLALAGLTWSAGTRSAPAADQSVRITLDSITPEVVTSGDTVTISGQVTNTSDTTLNGVQAYLWRDSNTLLTTREELETARDYQPLTPVGRRYTPSVDYLPSEQDATLQPDQTVDFTVSAPVDALELPAGDGVALIGVQIRGWPTGGANATLGRARAFLPQDLDGSERDTPVTAVAVLASRPSRVAPDTFIDDHLAEEVGPGGRLTDLLAAAGRNGRSWLVDPALIVSLTDMADGYRLTDGQAGAGSADARAWLAGFDQLDTPGRRLPYADADVNVLADIGHPELLGSATSTDGLPATITGLRVAVLPAGGTLTGQGLGVITGYGRDDLVLTSATIGSLHASVGDADVVGYETSPYGPAPGPDPRDSDAQLRQSAAATLLLDTLAGRPGQVRLLTSARDARLDREDNAARRTLDDLLNEVTPSPLDTDGLDVGPVIASGPREAITGSADSLQGIGDLFVDPGTARELVLWPMLALTSGQWTDEGPFDVFRSEQRRRAGEILSGDAVAISARPVFLTARQDTQFPVTVTNNLAVPVHVRLTFESENAARLHVPDSDPVTVGAGEAVTVVVTPRVEANGRYTVVAGLATPSGKRVGRPVDIEVEATQVGRVGWIIMIASGAVVVGTTVLRIHQVRRERGVR